MKELTFRIPELGKRPGTHQWLADKLDNAEVRVSKTKGGMTALYIDFEDGDTDFLCRPITDPEDEMAAHQNGYDVRELRGQKFKVMPVSTDSDPSPIRGLFGALTPAAEETAKEWHEGIVEAFAKQWEHDGEEEGSVTVTVA